MSKQEAIRGEIVGVSSKEEAVARGVGWVLETSYISYCS